MNKEQLSKLKQLNALPAKHAAHGQGLSFLQRFARKRIIDKLQRIEVGCIHLKEGSEELSFGDLSSIDSETVHIEVIDARFWTELAFSGNTGGGEAYIQGYWRCENLTALIRLLLRNREILNSFENSALPWAKLLDKLNHFLKRNTESGSASNIAAHYDLGNDFFELFLDQKLMYSSAFYPSSETDLEQAATAKLERICQKLELSEDDHVLEIGTGWGGFAIYAASHFGCKVTTTTISQEQYNFAKKRVIEAGLEGRITLLLEDYRKLEGEYDKVVSIEMIEAVGHQFLDTYIKQCSELLKQNGVLFLQAITIRDQEYEKAAKRVDFIKKFVFPGGFLPSVGAISSAMTRVSNLKIVHLEDIGIHYAKTLADWRSRFNDNVSRVREQGFPDSFIRLWEFYLCYCEGSFREAYIGTVQVLANKPLAETPTLAAKIDRVAL